MKQSSIHSQEAHSLHQQRMQTLGIIYERYAKDVQCYFFSYCHDKMKSEDMTHDLFLKLTDVDVIYEHSARALLFTTASRMIIDDARHFAYIRKYKQDVTTEIERFDTFSIEKKMDQEHMARVISIKLDQMPQKCAAVYSLFFRKGKRAKEIAKELNIGVRTVEGYIYTSKKQVKEHLLQVFNR